MRANKAFSFWFSSLKSSDMLTARFGVIGGNVLARDVTNVIDKLRLAHEEHDL